MQEFVHFPNADDFRATDPFLVRVYDGQTTHERYFARSVIEDSLPKSNFLHPLDRLKEAFAPFIASGDPRVVLNSPVWKLGSDAQ